MKNYLKATYIFSLLPQQVKSHCLTSLNNTQRSLLEKGLTEISTLTTKQQITILTEYINYLQRIQLHYIHLRDICVIISFSIFVVLIMLSVLLSYGSGRALSSMMYILQYGGAHAIISPFIAVYAYRVMQKQIILLLTPLHTFRDLLGALGATIAIILLFSVTIHAQAIVVTKISIATGILSITAVPFTEELFFRGIIFLHGGKKYGYGASWIFTSFVFATIHLPPTPMEFLAYFMCSSILCYVAYRYSLFACLVSHALSNGLLFLL
ncbi:MAG: type II CAAX endopeptidase family protein [Spirochaetota bacterium]